jgi:hypothetical protein
MKTEIKLNMKHVRISQKNVGVHVVKLFASTLAYFSEAPAMKKTVL